MVQGAHIVKHGRKKKRKTISYGSGSVAAFHAGTVTLTIRPTGVARAALARLGHLSVLVTIKFTPANGGAPTTHQTMITVSAPKKKRHK